MLWTSFSFIFQSESNHLYWIGFVVFVSSYVFVRRILREILSRKAYEDFSVTLSMRTVGSFQSIFAIVVGLTIISQCSVDIMRARCFWSNSFAKFCTCYFFVDLFVMYLSFLELKKCGKFGEKEKSVGGILVDASFWSKDNARTFLSRNRLMAFHHIALPLIFGPIVVGGRRDLGDFFVGVLYLVEASTPFVNLRAVLRLFDLHQTPLYILNGVCMILAFFACRVAVFPFLYDAYASYAGISFWQVPTSIPIKCNLGCLVLASMQVYWFGLMIKATLKILKRRSED